MDWFALPDPLTWKQWVHSPVEAAAIRREAELIVAKLVRSTYVVVFSTDANGTSEGGWRRGWIRFERFVPSVLASGGVYTALYETTLSNLYSLADMQLQPLQMQPLDICCTRDRYVTSAALEAALEAAHAAVEADDLCPWTGEFEVDFERRVVSEACRLLLHGVANLPPVADLNHELVEHAWPPSEEPEPRCQACAPLECAPFPPLSESFVCSSSDL